MAARKEAHGHLLTPTGLLAIATRLAKDVQTKMLNKTTFLLKAALGGVALAGGGLDAKEANDRYSVGIAEAFPESNQGKFVAIFDELTRQWATRRDGSAKQIVQRDFKVVRER